MKYEACRFYAVHIEGESVDSSLMRYSSCAIFADLYILHLMSVLKSF